MSVFASQRLFVSALAIIGLMMFGQMSASAQSALGNPDISPSATLKQQAFNGGFYQVIDLATAPCNGQCAVANWQTGDCTCPPGFTQVVILRALIAVTGGTCGATQFSCVLPAQ
jgi:hypothetical protein